MVSDTAPAQLTAKFHTHTATPGLEPIPTTQHNNDVNQDVKKLHY